MTSKSWFLTAAITLLWAGSVAATDFYVDSTGGDDSWNGRYPAHQGGQDGPWQTVQKVNDASFSPGDSILFRRGEIWNQRLQVPSAGETDNPVTFGAYGDGEKPILDVENNEDAVISCWVSHITFQDLVLKNSNNNALSVGVTGGTYGITVLDVETYNAGNNGISISKGGQGIHIARARVVDSSNNGIHLGGSPAPHLSDVVVEDCFVSGTSGNDCITIHEDGDNNPAGSSFLIRNNVTEHCAEQGFDITTGSDVLLTGNVSSLNEEGGVVVGHSAHHVTIDRHHSTDEPIKEMSAAINIGGTDGQVRLLNSVIEGDGYHLLRISTGNVEILNNTFVWNGGGSTFDMTGPIDNVTVKNNVFTTRQDSMGRVRFLEETRPADHPTFDFDHNIYWAVTPLLFLSGGSNYEFDAYQTTLGVEPNSSYVDPELADREGGDYHLTQNSPAVDTALDLDILWDFEDNPRPRDGDGDDIAAPDIGAFEFQPPEPDGGTEPDASQDAGQDANEDTGEYAGEDAGDENPDSGSLDAGDDAPADVLSGTDDESVVSSCGCGRTPVGFGAILLASLALLGLRRSSFRFP